MPPQLHVLARQIASATTSASSNIAPSSVHSATASALADSAGGSLLDVGDVSSSASSAISPSVIRTVAVLVSVFSALLLAICLFLCLYGRARCCGCFRKRKQSNEMEKSPAVPSKNEGPLPTLQKDEEALPIGGLWMSGGLKTLAPVRTPARVPSPVRVESKRVSRTSLPEDYAARDWPLRAPVSPLPEINRSPLKVTMESQDETAIKEKKPNVIPRKPAPNAV